MAAAEVGDDVYGEDPTVNRLEATAAEHLNKEAALFVSSGTQANLLAIMSHCGRGDEYIAGQTAHNYQLEGGGAAVLGGIQPQPVPFADNGELPVADIRAAIKPDDPHFAVSRLLCIENTHRGKAIPLAAMQAASAAAREHGLAVHLDGARLFNATAALGVSAADIAATADTVSLCLSKGLGTPAGTLLLGPDDVMRKARRWRKVLGGAMRQTGVLAAAGLHALKHNVTRLADDHRRAATLARHLVDIGAGDPGRPPRAETCMVFFTPAGADHTAFRAAMAEHGVLLGGRDRTIRIVFHKDIDDAKLERVCEAFKAVCRA